MRVAGDGLVVCHTFVVPTGSAPSGTVSTEEHEVTAFSYGQKLGPALAGTPGLVRAEGR